MLTTRSDAEPFREPVDHAEFPVRNFCASVLLAYKTTHLVSHHMLHKTLDKIVPLWDHE